MYNISDKQSISQIGFKARLVRNINVAKDPNVKRIMEVADDFIKKTAEKYPDLELRMYKNASDDFVKMSLFNKQDRFVGQGQGVFRVESLVEDCPSNTKLVGRLKKLINYFKKEDALMALSDKEVATGKADSILKQMEKIAEKDNVLQKNLELLNCIF